MANELLSPGITYTLVQNRLYALPSTVTFITSSAAVEVSLDGITWGALANATTGAVTGANFIRSTLVNTIVALKKATIATVSAGGLGLLDDLAFRERLYSELSGITRRGTLANISDSTKDNPGQTVQGGGTDNVLARYDGTKWIVVS